MALLWVDLVESAAVEGVVEAAGVGGVPELEQHHEAECAGAVDALEDAEVGDLGVADVVADVEVE